MDIAAVYFVWGKEIYLVEKKVKNIVEKVKKFYGDNTEIVYAHGDEMNHYRLGEMLQFNPLFAINRIVVIKKPLWLGSNYKKVKSFAAYENIIKEYLNSQIEGQILILWSEEKNAGNPLVKLLDKKAQVIAVPEISNNELEKWIKAELKNRQIELSPGFIKKMSNCGQDMNYIINFIEKIALFNVDSRPAETELEGQLDFKKDINIFKLTDAVLNRNIPVALEAYSQLVKQGQPLQLTFFMLAKQFTIFSRIKALREEGFSTAEIGKITNQKPYPLKKMLEKTGNFQNSEIEKLLRELLLTDINFKSSSKDSHIIMETLILKFGR